MIKSWPLLDSEPLGNYRIFTMRQDKSRSPRTQREHTFFVLDAPDWINIIPITHDGNVVLINQFRHGTKTVELEIPGGMMDPEDPTPAVAAERELLEETGYAIEQIIHIGSATPNPAFLTNQIHTYLALGAHKVQEPSFDGSEDIETIERPLSAIPNLIASGQITHALVITGFYHLENHRRQNPAQLSFASDE